VLILINTLSAAYSLILNRWLKNGNTENIFTGTFDHFFCTTNYQTKQNKSNEIKDKLLEYLKRFYVQLIKKG